MGFLHSYVTTLLCLLFCSHVFVSLVLPSASHVSSPSYMTVSSFFVFSIILPSLPLFPVFYSPYCTTSLLSWFLQLSFKFPFSSLFCFYDTLPHASPHFSFYLDLLPLVLISTFITLSSPVSTPIPFISLFLPYPPFLHPYFYNSLHPPPSFPSSSTPSVHIPSQCDDPRTDTELQQKHWPHDRPHGAITVVCISRITIPSIARASRPPLMLHCFLDQPLKSPARRPDTRPYVHDLHEALNLIPFVCPVQERRAVTFSVVS